MPARRPLLLGVFVAAASCAHGVDPEGPGSALSLGGGASSGGISSSGGALGSGTGNSTDVSTGGSSSAGGASSGGTVSGAGTSSSGGATISSGGASRGGTTASGGAAGSGGSPTVVVPAGDLVVQYMPGNTTDKTSIHANFGVVNRGKKTVPLAQLTLRYWYTADGTATGSSSQETHVDYAEISRLTNMRTSVMLSTAAVKPAQTGADTYLEVGFMGPDSIGPDQQTIDHMPLVDTKQIQVRVNWPGYSTQYDQSNDYSFDATKTSYADWPKVTLYQNGTLIWGIEPDGTKPADNPSTGGDASTPDAGP